MRRILFYMVMVSALPFFIACGQSTPLSPVISSEDFDLDNGGSDIRSLPAGGTPADPYANLCPFAFEHRLALGVKNVKHGSYAPSQSGQFVDPHIFSIGREKGGLERRTEVTFEIITDTPTLRHEGVAHPKPVFLMLFDLKNNQSIEFPSEFVLNEPIVIGQRHIGNRVGIWWDEQGVLDGILETDTTYVLQSCFGLLFDETQNSTVFVASAPFFFQVRFSEAEIFLPKI